MVFFLRKSGANIVVRVVDVVVEVAVIIDVPRVVKMSLLGEQHYPQKSCTHIITNSYMSKAFLHEL